MKGAPNPDISQQRRFSTLRLAISLVYSAGPHLLLAIVGASVVTSVAVAGQLLLGRNVLNKLSEADHTTAEQLAPYLIGMGCLLLVSSLSQAVSGELRLPLTERVHRRSMDEILDVATEVEYEAYEGAEFHDRLQRARFAAGGQSSAVVFGLVTIVSTLVITIGVVAVLVSVAPVLLPVAIISYVPIVFVNIHNTRARYQLEHELTELQRDRSYLEYLMTDRGQAKEVRSYDIAPTLRQWHSHLWDTRMTRVRALVRQRLTLTTIGSTITTTALIVTLSIALILAGRGSISIGDAAVAIVGLQQLSTRLRAAGSSFNSVHEGVTFLRDFDSFRLTLPEIRDRRATGSPPSPPATLAVQRLGYRYPGASDDALRSVTFALKRGQIMAVVGANGSGKSTMAKLLSDLLSPTRGTIVWDGVDLATCDPYLVRSQIACVFQDYATYMFTIRRTIGLGDARRLDDDAAIQNAAAQVGMDELIETLPEGIETRLGKMFAGGTDLSVGQWQRLAIARALFRDAPVVILDEPSASLDPRAEADLFDLLHTLCDDRIVIFVSHRFATVRSADVVMVLDQGEIVELGSHDELMAARGLYCELYELQAERYGFAS